MIALVMLCVSTIRSPVEYRRLFGLALDEAITGADADVPRAVITDTAARRRFHGPISIGEALVRPLNLPAVRVKPMDWWFAANCVGCYVAQRCCTESFAHSRRRRKLEEYGGSVAVCRGRQVIAL